jgi:DNA-directed RNA polymerase II subunit RPB1
MEDDLTHKFADIIKFNNTLKLKIDKNERAEIITTYTDMVQYHVATMVDNEISGVSPASYKQSGRPLKALRQRLKGKEGRIRSNLMGKRVDFSARSVITPDPNLALDELGVPSQIAMNLTYPEKVNTHTIERLQRLVSNGPKVWPGAKSVERHSSGIFTISDHNRDMVLENGDIVNRHLCDGDYVLFNRQPSLHKMSMMGHRVKVMKGNTFRLNVSVTPPYNADFDGDEMNLHAPQSIAAVAELVNIASVNHQIISPRENKPIITIVQDTLLGIYKLTHSEIVEFPKGSPNNVYYADNTNIYQVEPQDTSKCVNSCVFTRTQMMNIVCDLSTFKGIPPEPDTTISVRGETVEMWSGHSILSFILPDTVNLDMPNGKFDTIKDTDTVDTSIKSHNDQMNVVKIVNGKVIQGTFDKSMFSKTSKGLIHTICNDLGPMMAHHLINDLQKIVSYILLIDGFSVGISDMIADSETTDKINEVIKERKREIDEMVQEVHLNIFVSLPGKSKQEFFEGKVNSLLNKTLKDTGKIGLASLDPKNRTTYMVNSGSKGKLINISQMVACLGQQNVDGARIPYGFQGRTLPHYYKYDDSPEARGFIENSFISGQTPQEFYFHAMAGREGLIDTAVKTASTGYVQRQLVKSMEDLMVGHDYSVRTSRGTIVQFVYGNDGMDATYVESQPLYLTELTLDKLVEKFSFSKDTSWSQYLHRDLVPTVSQDVMEELDIAFKVLLNHRMYLLKIVYDGYPETHITYPVHIKRIVENICLRPHKGKSTITPLDILEGNDQLKNELYVRTHFRNNRIFEILIDVHLNPKVLIKEYNITESEYEEVTDLIRSQYQSCRISPGEMVGVLAAQSIGEPATQMTLNTFHFAGVGAKSNVTRGIPRLKELIHVSKNMKSPITKIVLLAEYIKDEHKAKYVKNQLEHTILQDIIISSSLYYDPLHITYGTDITEDQELMALYKEFLEIDETYDETSAPMSPWILRMVFDKETMMDKGITMEDVSMALLRYDKDKITFIFTDDNSKDLIGRISLKIEADTRFEQGIQDQSDIISSFQNINEDLNKNVVIKGIPSIHDITISEHTAYRMVDRDIQAIKEYILESDGVNLLKIMASDYTDSSQCYSNDLIEINNVLGIEAARDILMKEIIEVVEHADEYINRRHIEVLSDIMTSRGILMSINRQGINRGEVGPLGKCSFEDTTDQLIKASIFSELDTLNGVSSNIMMGQTIRAGTGLADILLDDTELSTLMKDYSDDVVSHHEINETIIDHYLEGDEPDDECAMDNFLFSFE